MEPREEFDGGAMNRHALGRLLGLTLLFVLFSASMFGQTNCEEGNSPLNPVLPSGITATQVIERFAAKEAVFKQARDNYSFTADVTVQTLDGSTVDAEFRQVWDITYDDKGKRVENVTFAPPSTLQRVTLTKEDFDDLRDPLPFALTTEDLPLYEVLYVGLQHLDEIDTYVFDVAPKKIEIGARYFQGRIWVDNRDLQIVKTCGKNTRYTKPAAEGRGLQENLAPRFVTYREQIDGQYWFPTYSRADDVMHFRSGDVRIRAIIKYTKYKRFGSRSRIIFKGELPPNQKPK